MKLKIASSEHEVAYRDILALLAKHAETLTALEVLAIAGNLVGKLIAMQDPRVVTPKLAMDIVSRNIELGNQQMIAIGLVPEGHA